MRIIAGQWRGRPLEAPLGQATRPTADRVRETLFSMLASRLGTFEDLRIADLFAGSGALGLEALSRGAALAVFVENDAQAAAAIKRNLAKLGAERCARLVGGSAHALPRSEPFDLIFADPPYSQDSGSAALTHILASDWAKPGSWVAIETERGEIVAPVGCSVESERDVGRARLTLLTR
jgi:16S rRNA (guanine966-N2)-methyltransferase